MGVSVRVVATCERPKTISTEPQLLEIVSVLRILNHLVLRNILSGASMVFLDTAGVFRKIPVKKKAVNSLKFLLLGVVPFPLA